MEAYLFDDNEPKSGQMLNIRQTSMLVVDDSHAMRTVVSNMLAQFGVPHIDRAQSGEEALNKIEASRFTIIISDWNMEPMNGLELLRSVVSRQKPRMNRFIFMTSERSWGHQTTARIEGADDFITKPFLTAALKAKIDKVLARC